ncbi:MAG: hypothetical protein GQ582_02165 [Methyloprofundus sp.]|nr:hypothetical protein [Methyloprofundus sp.]
MNKLKLTILCSLFLSQAANAVPFDSSISITGSTTFDDSFGSGNTSGQMTNTESGVETSTIFSGAISTGSNPLNGTLFDIGDGFSFGGSGSATNGEFSIGIDNQFTITNNSTADFEVILGLNYSNSVNTTGADAFSDSEFSFSIGGAEVFFTDLVSDTVNGNSIGGTFNGDFGGSLLDASSTGEFTLLLSASDTISLSSFWTLEGGDFNGGTAEFESLFSFNVLSVTDQSSPPITVPAPGILALMNIALFGFFFSRQRKVTSV